MTGDRVEPSKNHELPADEKPVVYTAMPKYLAVMDPYIGAYVYNNDAVPITPWMYPFWLLDQVDRAAFRNGNAQYIDLADEVWVFSTESGQFTDAIDTLYGLDIHDGVLREIEQANRLGTPIRFHHVDHDSQRITHVGTVTEPWEPIPEEADGIPETSSAE